MLYNIRGKNIDCSDICSMVERNQIGQAKKELEQAFKIVTNERVAIANHLVLYVRKNKNLPDQPYIEQLIADKEKQARLAMHRRYDEQQPYKTKQKSSFSPTIGHQPTRSSEPNAPTCPTCHSTRLTKLSAGTRFIDRMFFGAFSPESRAQFRCMDCGYLF